MWVGALGQVEVVDDSGDRSVVGAAQEQVLVVALVLAGGAAVSSGQLIDVIWGDEPPASASSALKALVHRLRRRHGRHLVVTAASGYQLGPEVDSDHAQVLASLRRGDEALGRGDIGSAIEAFAQAAGRFGSEPTPALVATVAGVGLERSITELRSTVRDRLVDARLAGGGGEDLIGELEAMVEAEPLAERRWERLMVALYRSGRQAAALGAYARARAALVDGAGLEPGPGLRALEGRILDHDPSLGPVRPLTVEVDIAPPDDSEGHEGEAGSEAADLSWFHAALALTGRDEQLDAITSTRSRTAGSFERQLVLISGDAGMGKTRLAGEAASAAAAGGTVVLYGACDPSIASAYRPFALALDRCAALHPEALVDAPGLELVARLAPALGDRFGVAEADRSDDIDDDHRLHAAYAAVVNHLARPHGLVLVVDDCQWAAAPTIDLLRHLLGDPTAVDVTIIATYRPRDLTATSPIAMTLADLHRNPRCTPVHLDRLGHDDIHALVEASAGHAVPDEVAERLVSTTGGNPYLVAATLRHLTDTDLVVRRNQRWELAPGALDALPAGVRHLVTQQVTALPAPAVTLLDTAAVAGLTFDLDVIAAVAGMTLDGALDAIETAALAGLVREDGFNRWRWDHDLARNVVADRLSTTRRVQTHWRIAQALAARSAPDHDDIAHHTIEGLLAAPATDAARRLATAADAALRHDPAAALIYTDAALEHLATTTDPHLHTTLLTLRAMALAETIGDLFDPAVAAAMAQAQGSSLLTGDADLIVRSHTFDDRHLAALHVLWNDAEHVAACERALDHLPADAWDHRAQLLGHLVDLTRAEPEMHGRVRGLLDVALEQSSAAVRAEVKRRTDRRPVDVQFVPSSHQDSVCNQLFTRSRALLSSGRFTEADTAATALAERLGDDNPVWTIAARTHLAVVDTAQGDIHGLRRAQEWLDSRFREPGRYRPLVAEFHRSLTGALALVTGEDNGVVATFGALIDQPGSTHVGSVVYRIATAWAAMLLGNHDVACHHLDVLLETETGLDGPLAMTAGFTELVCSYRPELADDPALTTAMRPASGTWLDVIALSLGPVDYYLAKIATVTGADPVPYWSAALASAEAGGATFWVERIKAIDPR